MWCYLLVSTCIYSLKRFVVALPGPSSVSAAFPLQRSPWRREGFISGTSLKNSGIFSLRLDQRDLASESPYWRCTSHPTCQIEQQQIKLLIQRHWNCTEGGGDRGKWEECYIMLISQQGQLQVAWLKYYILRFLFLCLLSLIIQD